MIITKFAKKEGYFNNRNWWIIDAEGKTLGRMATKVAHVLRGKHKSVFSYHVDTGDFVVVINANKVKVTGNKELDKIYHRHTGFPGGIKSIKFYELLEKHPNRAIINAVKGMMPKNALNRKSLLRLKVYNGSEHPHQSNKLKPLSI